MSDLYQQAGVSIDTGHRAVELMKQAVTSTHGPEVLAGIGAFGGLFSLSGQFNGMTAPALVASTDGVGTKVKLAAAMGQYGGIGHDIVNHCLNDIACAGENVKPLLFLDYIASSKLQPAMVAEVITGMAKACRSSSCALLGGETAEMPGVYQPQEFDVVGTVVGLVDADRIFPHPTLAAGDVLIGLPSSGAHTNGYSLIRAIFADVPLETEVDGVGQLGQALLEPHRCYLGPLARLHQAGIPLQGAAHITGGGLVENIPRALPPDLTARINPDAWPVPPLFRYIQQTGGVSNEEMRRVFNLGIGLVIIVKAALAKEALAVLDEGWLVGEVVHGYELEWID
jgi:phosphoribosylformylglycinamidine cyclo-ligase